MLPIFKKLGFLYNSYVLAILTIGYVLGELGHYLIGVTSKQTAIELDYGDHACQQNDTRWSRLELPVACSMVQNETQLVFIFFFSFISYIFILFLMSCIVALI